MKIYFDSHMFTHYVPSDGHNVTLKTEHEKPIFHNWYYQTILIIVLSHSMHHEMMTCV
jgi:hypothetical protein